MSKRRTFQKRVEQIFKGFEVFLYRECPTGASKLIPVDDHRPWVEFDLRDLNKSHSKASCAVPLKALVRLSKLLGTLDITATGFDMSDADDGTDSVGYVLAHGVKFK